MITYLSELAKQVLTPIFTIAVIGYLIRRYLDLSFKTEFEKFKTRINTEAKKDLYEFQTRYSALHQKRMEVIATVYSLLAKSRRLTKDLISPIQLGVPPLSEKVSTAFTSFNELSIFFDDNRIYFSEKTCNQCEPILQTMAHSLATFQTAHVQGMGNQDKYAPDQTGLWVKSWEEFDQHLPPLMKSLETEFRELMNA
jgi:hypothetical protein